MSVYLQFSIEDFCETGSGGTPSRANKEYYGGSIPWVKSGELREDIITDTEEKIMKAENAQKEAHENGDACEEFDCQDCCGEFYGHEYDTSEGGYCECGANGYENGE